MDWTGLVAGVAAAGVWIGFQVWRSRRAAGTGGAVEGFVSVDPAADPERVRRLSVGAILAEDNGFPIDALHPGKPVPAMRAWLSDFWGIRSGEDARMEVEKLLQGAGHGPLFDAFIQLRDVPPDQRLEVLRLHAPHARPEDLQEFLGHYPAVLGALRGEGLCGATEAPATAIAYDWGRAVVVARVALGAEFLTADEVDVYVRRAAELARGRFGSWSAFAASYLFARGVWGGVDDPSFRGQCQIARELLTLPASPWVRCGWW